jgi:hypothetical protein
VQFSLLKLLLFVPVFAMSLATFGVWGIAVILFLAPQILLFRNGANRVELIVVWGLVFVMGSCAVHGHREAYRLSGCRNDLKCIGLALHNYHEQYGRFPPQYVPDAEGRPMHSWRVLILPYLDEPAASAAYQQYRFDEPWNSPHNQKMAAQIGKLFRCRTTEAAGPSSSLATHYVGVTGPRTVWPGPTGTHVEGITDGCDNTVMLLEIADSDIHWMEPRDIPLEEALSDDNGARSVPSSRHYKERTYFFQTTYPVAGNVLMVDGDCHSLESRPSRDDLAALLSINGGERVDTDAVFRWHRSESFLGLDLGRCMSFALFLVFFALLSWPSDLNTQRLSHPKDEGPAGGCWTIESHVRRMKSRETPETRKGATEELHDLPDQ